MFAHQLAGVACEMTSAQILKGKEVRNLFLRPPTVSFSQHNGTGAAAFIVINIWEAS